MAMLIILGQNGLGAGGLNFDAKVRRSSNDPMDLFHAHIGGMDAFARGLLIAHRIREDGPFARFIEERYGSYASGIGSRMMSGKATLQEVETWVLGADRPVLVSGRQEMLENILNSYIL
jgi:xylose isomerase